MKTKYVISEVNSKATGKYKFEYTKTMLGNTLINLRSNTVRPVRYNGKYRFSDYDFPILTKVKNPSNQIVRKWSINQEVVPIDSRMGIKVTNGKTTIASWQENRHGTALDKMTTVYDGSDILLTFSPDGRRTVTSHV